MFASQVLDDLNDRQRDAATHDGAPLLIVAGAGTGKTKTLVSRVIRLIDDGADPNRILLLTFTRRASAEMLSRVAATSTNRAASQVWGGTFHATANRLLRSYGQAAGLAAGFTVLDQGDSTDLFGMVRTDEGFGERGKRFPRKETIANIYSRMVNSQAKLGEVLDTDFPWSAEHADDLKTIFTAYTARKRRHQVLDYDDMLLFWRGLLASKIGDTMRGLFDHILIDEYQDTNPIQADIIRGMCRPDTQVCAVGDDAQAIYGFRSATVANMWAFPEHFPGARIVTLEQNYRSTTPILDLANAVMTASDHGGDDGSAQHFDKQLWSTRSGGTTPKLVTCHDEADQSAYVADAILDARERGIDLRQQAVLFRAGHHSDHLELELTRRDIPYVKYGGLKYLEAAHVKDLLALLRILDNPSDQLAWRRVLASIEGVGPATLRKLAEAIGLDPIETGRRKDDPTGSPPSATAPSGTNDTALLRFLGDDLPVPAAAAEQVAVLRAALTDCSADGIPPAEQIDRLKAFCELSFAANYENAAARLADIDQLAATAAAYDNRSRFLTELTLDPPERTGDRAGPPHLDDDWLTLSTIHSAKGMEWRAVHVIHTADGNMPSDMAIGDRDGLAEELRLMYVALTRAKDELTATFPLRYHVHRYANDDRHLYAQMSRFFEPVREYFDLATTRDHPSDAVIELDSVGVADEVDTLLHSLWE
ncbi:MAG: ATP-dependent helicase [Acidimicrobiales bacterium]